MDLVSAGNRPLLNESMLTKIKGTLYGITKPQSQNKFFFIRGLIPVVNFVLFAFNVNETWLKN